MSSRSRLPPRLRRKRSPSLASRVSKMPLGAQVYLGLEVAQPGLGRCGLAAAGGAGEQHDAAQGRDSGERFPGFPVACGGLTKGLPWPGRPQPPTHRPTNPFQLVFLTGKRFCFSGKVDLSLRLKWEVVGGWVGCLSCTFTSQPYPASQSYPASQPYPAIQLTRQANLTRQSDLTRLANLTRQANLTRPHSISAVNSRLYLDRTATTWARQRTRARLVHQP